MRVVIGSDHRGFAQKEKVKKALEAQGFQVEDRGNLQEDKNDDYPVFAKAVAITLYEKKAEKGILFCGSGVGMSVVANKIPSIRAGLGFSIEQVKAGRHDDDMNILVIPVDYVEDKMVHEMVKVFLETPFASDERYSRRITQITDIEELVKTYE